MFFIYLSYATFRPLFLFHSRAHLSLSSSISIVMIFYALYTCPLLSGSTKHPIDGQLEHVIAFRLPCSQLSPPIPAASYLTTINGQRHFFRQLDALQNENSKDLDSTS